MVAVHDGALIHQGDRHHVIRDFIILPRPVRGWNTYPASAGYFYTGRVEGTVTGDRQDLSTALVLEEILYHV